MTLASNQYDFYHELKKKPAHFAGFVKENLKFN